MTELTAERLMDVLSYSPRSGLFRWKVKPNRNIRIGDVAGTIQSNGYRYINIDGRKYLAHRLAWLWVFGRFPDHEIDHINGIGRLDQDRLQNLREASRSENMRNRQSRNRNNISGFHGVGFHRQRGKYLARVHINGRNHFLGYFDAPEAASVARNEAAQRLHAEFYSDGTRQ
ncbi:HNH endonuclease [Bradyrhizobium macuxiense]|uniref:HNH endonuclease n=1 Tax=Bradyrhizobium macuxiense TaxID=1755647 RepID=UPI0009E6A877|nr:HNH endonuclease [Bradyrhizobium macuxiense]